MHKKTIFITTNFLLFVVLTSSAQITEVIKRNGRQLQENSFRFYQFTSAESDTISIKVINPRGEIQTIPVRKQPSSSASKLDFRFNTRYWEKGRYTIVVENKKGTMYTKRMEVKRKE